MFLAVALEYWREKDNLGQKTKIIMTQIVMVMILLMRTDTTFIGMTVHKHLNSVVNIVDSKSIDSLDEIMIGSYIGLYRERHIPQ